MSCGCPADNEYITYGCDDDNCKNYPCESQDDCTSVSPAYVCSNGFCTSQLCTKDGDCRKGASCNDYGRCDTTIYTDNTNLKLLIVIIVLILGVIAMAFVVYFVIKHRRKNPLN